MTLSSTAVYQVFNGNGSTTNFSVTAFQWWEIEVTHIAADGTETAWTEGSQFSLLDEDANPMTGGDGRKGTVVVDTSPVDYTPASGEKLRVWRVTAPTQETIDLEENDAFPSSLVEYSFDREAMKAQEILQDLKRVPMISKADHVALAGAALTLPTPEAGKVLVWNDDEDGFDNQDSPADSVTAAAASAAAAAASASAASTSASTASTAATNASTSATNAATSATNAATSATAAQTAETNAETAETNAEAAQTAAEAAQAAAEAAQTAAETAETNAETAATNASNSASAASTSATNAATSETNAATSATNAGNSATAAQTAETNAETAETNAEAAQAAAEAAQTAAETAETNAETAQAAAEAAQAAAEAASENPAFTFTFDSSTADADPGAGEFRLNNATLASVTTVYIDNADADGNTISAYLDSFDDVGATAGRGHLLIKGVDTPTAFFIGTVTGTITDGTGYRKVTVSHVASGGTFTASEEFSVLFTPAGATGANGAGAGDVVGPASSTDNAIARYHETTGEIIQDSGVTIDDSNNVTGIATLTLPNTGLHLLDTNATHDLIVAPGSNLTADRTLTLTTGDADRTLTLIGNATIRETLTASRTYYVRTDGNDGNTGLVDSAGGAFLTIAHALDVVWDQIDLAGFDVTIDVADGTYTDPLFKERPHVGHGIVTILGNTSTPANVLIDVTGNGVQMYNGAAIRLNGLKIEATERGIYAAWGGHVFFQNVDFGACGSFHIRAAAGEVSAIGDYTVSAGAPAHWAAHIGGAINVASRTITITGTPAFSTAFAYVETGGFLEVHGNTFSGSATGQRSRTLVGGFIWVGLGVNSNSYLPGNSNGLITAGAIGPLGIVNATTIYSGVKDQSIADDGVYTFDLSAITSGIVLMTIHTGSGAKTAVPVGQFRVRASASPFTENISLDLTAVTLTTGALTGTTGTDGRFTISPHTDGLVYFENRTGSTRFITLLIM